MAPSEPAQRLTKCRAARRGCDEFLSRGPLFDAVVLGGERSNSNHVDHHDELRRVDRPVGKEHWSTDNEYGIVSPGELLSCLADVLPVRVLHQHVDDLAERKDECQVEEQLEGIGGRKVVSNRWRRTREVSPRGDGRRSCGRFRSANASRGFAFARPVYRTARPAGAPRR